MMTRTHIVRPARSGLFLTTALAAALVHAPVGAQSALPIGGKISVGDVSATYSGGNGQGQAGGGVGQNIGITTNSTAKVANFTVNTDKSVITWGNPNGDFSIDSGNKVNFINGTGNASFSVLNRVTTNNISSLSGTLDGGGGTIWLINENGIALNGKVENVFGLVFSTLDVTNADFAKDLATAQNINFKSTQKSNITLANGSSIDAAGNVLLLAPKIVTQSGGNITATNDAALVVASDVTVNLTDNSIIKVTLNAGADINPANPVLDIGGNVSGNKVYAVAASADTISAALLNVSGTLTASHVTATENGIILSAGNATAGGEVVINGFTPKNADAVVTGELKALGSSIEVVSGPNGAATVAGKVTAGGGFVVTAEKGVTLGAAATTVAQSAAGAVTVTTGGTSDLTLLGTLTLTADSDGAGGGDMLLTTKGAVTGAGANLVGGTVAERSKVTIDLQTSSKAVSLNDITAKSFETKPVAGEFGTTGDITLGNVTTTDPLTIKSTTGKLDIGAANSGGAIILATTGATATINLGSANATTGNVTIDAKAAITVTGTLDGVALVHAASTADLVSIGGAVHAGNFEVSANKAATVSDDVTATGSYDVTGASVTLGTLAATKLHKAGTTLDVQSTTGDITALGTLTLASDTAAGGGDLTIHSKKAILGGANLTGGTVADRANIVITQDDNTQTIVVGDLFGKQPANFSTAGDLTFGDVDFASDAVFASTGGTVIGGNVVATGKVDISAGANKDLTLDSAKSGATKTIKLTSDQNLTVNGDLTSGASTDVTATGGLALLKGNVTSGADYNVTGKTVTLGAATARTQQAKGAVTITSTGGDLTLTGPLTLASDTSIGGGDLVLHSAGAVTGASSTLDGGTSAEWKTVRVTLDDGTKAVALGDVNAAILETAAGVFKTAGAIGFGDIVVTGPLNIESTAANVSIGSAQSDDAVTLTASGAGKTLTVDGKIVSGTGFDVTLAADGNLAINNGTNAVDSGNNLNITSTNGQALVGGDVTLGRAPSAAGNNNYSVTGKTVQLGDGSATARLQKAKGAVTVKTTSTADLVLKDKLTLQSNSAGGATGDLLLDLKGGVSGIGSVLTAGKAGGWTTVRVTLADDTKTVALGDVNAATLETAGGLFKTAGVIGFGDIVVTEALSVESTGGNVTIASAQSDKAVTLTASGATKTLTVDGKIASGAGFDITLKADGDLAINNGNNNVDSGNDLTITSTSGQALVGGDLKVANNYAVTGNTVQLGDGSATARLQQAKGGVTIKTTSAADLALKNNLTLQSNSVGAATGDLVLDLTGGVSGAGSVLTAGKTGGWTTVRVTLADDTKAVALGDINAATLETAGGLFKTAGVIGFGNIVTTNALNIESTGGNVTIGSAKSDDAVALIASGAGRTLTVNGALISGAGFDITLTADSDLAINNTSGIDTGHDLSITSTNGQALVGGALSVAHDYNVTGKTVQLGDGTAVTQAAKGAITIKTTSAADLVLKDNLTLQSNSDGVAGGGDIFFDLQGGIAGGGSSLIAGKPTATLTDVVVKLADPAASIVLGNVAAANLLTFGDTEFRSDGDVFFGDVHTITDLAIRSVNGKIEIGNASSDRSVRLDAATTIHASGDVTSGDGFDARLYGVTGVTVDGLLTAGFDGVARSISGNVALNGGAKAARDLFVEAATTAGGAALTAGRDLIVQGTTVSLTGLAKAGDDIVIAGGSGGVTTLGLTTTGAADTELLAGDPALDSNLAPIINPATGAAFDHLLGSNIVVGATGQVIVNQAVGASTDARFTTLDLAMVKRAVTAGGDYIVTGAFVSLGQPGETLGQTASGAVTITATDGIVTLFGTGPVSDNLLTSNGDGLHTGAAGALTLAATNTIFGSGVTLQALRASGKTADLQPGVMVTSAAAGLGDISLGAVNGGTVSIFGPGTITVPQITAAGNVTVQGTAVTGNDVAMIAPTLVTIDSTGVSGPVNADVSLRAGAGVTAATAVVSATIGTLTVEADGGNAILTGTPTDAAATGTIIVKSQTGEARIVDAAANEVFVLGNRDGSQANVTGSVLATSLFQAVGPDVSLNSVTVTAGSLEAVAVNSLNLTFGSAGGIYLDAGGSVGIGTALASGSLAAVGSTVTVSNSVTAGDDIILATSTASGNIITSGATLTTDASIDWQSSNSQSFGTVDLGIETGAGYGAGHNVYGLSFGTVTNPLSGFAVVNLLGSNVDLIGRDVTTGTVNSAGNIRVEAGRTASLGALTATGGIAALASLQSAGNLTANADIKAGDDLVLVASNGSVNATGVTLSTTGFGADAQGGNDSVLLTDSAGLTIGTPQGGGIRGLGGANIVVTASGDVGVDTAKALTGNARDIKLAALGTVQLGQADATRDILVWGGTVNTTGTLGAGDDIALVGGSGGVSVSAVLTTGGTTSNEASSSDPLRDLAGNPLGLAGEPALSQLDGNSILVAATGPVSVAADVASGGRYTVLGRSGITLGTSGTINQSAVGDILVEASIAPNPAPADIDLAGDLTLTSNSAANGIGGGITFRLGNGSINGANATVWVKRSAGQTLANQGILTSENAVTDGVKAITLLTADAPRIDLRGLLNVSVTNGNFDAGMVLASKSGTASLTTARVTQAVPLMSAAELNAVDLGIFGATGATLAQTFSGSDGLIRDITIATNSGNASVTNRASARDDIVIASTNGTASGATLVLAGTPTDSEIDATVAAKDANGVALADPYNYSGSGKLDSLAGSNIVVSGGTGATITTADTFAGATSVRAQTLSGPATIDTNTPTSKISAPALVYVATKNGKASGTDLWASGDITVLGGIADLAAGHAGGNIYVGGGSLGHLGFGDANGNITVAAIGDATLDTGTAGGKIYVYAENGTALATDAKSGLGDITVQADAGDATLTTGNSGTSIIVLAKNDATLSDGTAKGFIDVHAIDGNALATKAETTVAGDISVTADTQAAKLTTGNAAGNISVTGKTDATLSDGTATGFIKVYAINGAALATTATTTAAGDVTVTADTGAATLTTGNSGGNISVTGKTGATLGDGTAKASISVHAMNGAALATLAKTTVAGDISVTSDSADATLVTGNAAGDILVKGQTDATLGDGTASGAITVQAIDGKALATSAITTTGDITVTSTKDKATLTFGDAGRDIVVKSVTAAVGDATAHRDLLVTATGGDIVLTTATKLMATRDIALTASGKVSADALEAGRNLFVSAGDTASIVDGKATGDVTVTAKSITLGTITAGDDIVAAASNGGVTATSLTTSATTGQDNEASDSVTAKTFAGADIADPSVATGNVTGLNGSNIVVVATGDIAADAGNAARNLRYASGTGSVTGKTVKAGTDVALTAKTAISVTAPAATAIQAVGHDVTLKSDGTTTVTGDIVAANNVAITSTGKVSLSGAAPSTNLLTATAGTVTITSASAADVTVDGGVLSNGTYTVDTLGKVTLSGAGATQKSTSGQVIIKSSDIELTATLVSADRTLLTVQGAATGGRVGDPTAAATGLWVLSAPELLLVSSPKLEINSDGTSTVRNLEIGTAATPATMTDLAFRSAGDINITGGFSFGGTNLTIGGTLDGGPSSKTDPVARSIQLYAQPAAGGGQIKVTSKNATVGLRATAIAIGQDAPQNAATKPFVSDVIARSGDANYLQTQYFTNPGSTLFTPQPGYAPPQKTLIGDVYAATEKSSLTLVLAPGKTLMLQNTGTSTNAAGGIDVNLLKLVKLQGLTADPLVAVFGKIFGQNGAAASLQQANIVLDGISPNNVRINGCPALQSSGCIITGFSLNPPNLIDPSNVLVVIHNPTLALPIDLISGASNDALWSDEDRRDEVTPPPCDPTKTKCDAAVAPSTENK